MSEPASTVYAPRQRSPLHDLALRLLAIGLLACSPGADETLGKSQLAIIECNGFSVGQRCDTDDDPCTQEVCVQEGQNVSCALERLAPDGTPCLSDEKPCTADSCQRGVCLHAPLESGTLCDDGLFCTDEDRCDEAGLCEGSATTCDDDNECTVDACDEDSRSCGVTVLVDSDCDDGNACTEGTSCDATGVCAGGTILVCTDESVCTSDSCDPRFGCEFVPAIDSPCDDVFFCTIAETCTDEGICAGEINCADGNACTIDICDEEGDRCDNVVTPGAECSDGNKCTSVDLCSEEGECVGVALDEGILCGSAGGCLSGGTCINGSCAGTTEEPEGSDCDDDNACTTSDTCSSGQCGGYLLDCNDNDPCTADGCDETSGCFHQLLQDCAQPPDAGTGDAGPGPGGGMLLDGGIGSEGDAGPEGVLGGGGCAVAASGGPSATLVALLLALALLAIRGWRRLAKLSLAMFLSFNAGLAHGQGFDSEIFKPATSTTSFLSQESADVLPAWSFNLGVSFSVVTDPLVLRDPDTGAALMDGAVISRRTAAYLSGGVGLFDRFEVGVALPFVLSQRGNADLLGGGQDLDHANLGDLRTVVKARLWERRGLALASSLSFTLPAGDSSALVGEAGVTTTARLILSMRRGAAQVATNLGVRARDRSETRGLLIDDEVSAGVGARYEVLDRRLWLLGEAYANQSLHRGGAESSPREALVGLRYALSGPWHLQAATGFGIGRGYGSPAFRGLLGLLYVPPDNTSPSPSSAPRLVVAKPHEPGADKAPALPQPEHDGDGDGLVDTEDLCPAAAEDVDGYQDEDGCPEMDNDGDTIVDSEDACPSVAEVLNGIDDEDGCPDEGLIEIVQNRITLGETVLFDKNRVRVKRKGRKALKAIIALYQQHPEWGPMHIEGHADHRGPTDFNQRLSTRRATRVREEMIRFGMETNKITSAGLGESSPLVPGEDKRAMQRNRRVEFVIWNEHDEEERMALPPTKTASAPATD